MRLLFALLVLLLQCEGALAGEVMGVASVIDGDTIEIHGERIRLNGIDAPESRQLCQNNGGVWRCGQEAALQLSDFISGTIVSCRTNGRDRYRRLLAICHAGGTDINGWMVRQGWALAYRKYSMAYVAQEDEARIGARGIWQGRFEAPWDWRAARR